MLYFFFVCNIFCENYDYIIKVIFFIVCLNVIVEILVSYIGLKYGKYFNIDYYGINLVLFRLLFL